MYYSLLPFRRTDPKHKLRWETTRRLQNSNQVTYWTAGITYPCNVCSFNHRLNCHSLQPGYQCLFIAFVSPGNEPSSHCFLAKSEIHTLQQAPDWRNQINHLHCRAEFRDLLSIHLHFMTARLPFDEIDIYIFASIWVCSVLFSWVVKNGQHFLPISVILTVLSLLSVMKRAGSKGSPDACKRKLISLLVGYVRQVSKLPNWRFWLFISYICEPSSDVFDLQAFTSLLQIDFILHWAHQKWQTQTSCEELKRHKRTERKLLSTCAAALCSRLYLQQELSMRNALVLSCNYRVIEFHTTSTCTKCECNLHLLAILCCCCSGEPAKVIIVISCDLTLLSQLEIPQRQ